MSQMIQLIYPETRMVSSETIMIWAEDALLNDETDEKAETLEDAIRILEDIGTITVSNRKQT